MNRFYNIPDDAKKRIYIDTGEKSKLPHYAVEKDWWVVQTLTILFELEIGKHLVFKGGTSLSKSWNLIERFSEDIDLSVDRSFFGFKGNLGKNQRTRLRKTSAAYITETLYPGLEAAFKSKGIPDIRIELEEITSSDQDPVIISVYYPSIIESPGYILPKVQIEIGCRSLHEPYQNTNIIALVDQIQHEAIFAQDPVQIPSVVPERTFLEKIFLLHEEFQRPVEKIRVERLSRHLYDIYQISKTDYADKALSNKELYETIVKHRNSFTKLGGVDYNLHQPQTINFIPPMEFMADWKEDYRIMQEQMIYGNSPGFDLLIDSLSVLNKYINMQLWKVDVQF